MIKKLSLASLLGITILGLLIGARAFLHNKRVDRHAVKLIEEQSLSAKIDATLARRSGEASAQTVSYTSNSLTKKTATMATLTPQKHQLQINPGYLAEWSAEDQFINYMKAKGYPDDYRWQFIFEGSYWNTKQADEAGFIDRTTGDPKKLPSGIIELQGPVMLFGYTKFPDWHAGDWVVTWEGDGEAYIYNPKIKVKSSKQTVSGGRMVLSVPRSGAEPFRVRFRDLKSPIRNLKLYRLRHEADVKKGHIWNPDFINHIKQYDIVRTMVLQDTNSSPARSWADIAKPDDPHFLYKGPVISDLERSAYGRYGLPFEFLFDLSKQSNTALWLSIPAQIGSTLDYTTLNGDVQKLLPHAQKNARAIVASPAWDEFAEEFKTRLIKGNYPKDKPLYIELGNEIWNYGWPFTISSKYVEGIAKGFKPDENLRYGYGILSARMMIAFETALDGTGYTPIYVIGSQTANPDMTRAAYRGLVAYLQSHDIQPESWIARTGVALTTYHGSHEAYQNLITPRTGETLRAAWEREIKLDPERLKRLIHAYYTRSSANVASSKAWVLQNWRAHRKIAQEFGAPLIGAYEGGSHDVPPQELGDSEIFNAWWTDYHWGPWGAEVVREINQAIIDEFPTAILSDFSGMGKIGEWQTPWIDGHYGEPTAMMEMWREFDRVK